MERICHHIAGTAVTPASGEWVANHAPATGAKIAEIARGNAVDVERAVCAAESALAGAWSSWTLAERCHR
jgi:aldehyde dehydrogenase (NAD+)